MRRIAPPLVVVWRRDGRFDAPRAWPPALRAAVRRFDCADRSAFFVAAPDADTASSARGWVLRLGHLRDRGGSRLDAAAMLSRELATPRGIAHAELSGAGSVVAFDPAEPLLAASTTLFGVPRLEYVENSEGLAVASAPALLLPLLRQPRLDPLVEPSIVLVRTFAGERGVLEGVHRLGWGRALRLAHGTVTLGPRRTLAEMGAELGRRERIDDEALTWVEERMLRIASGWEREADAIGASRTTLLSGGLDSSLLQLWVARAAGRPGRSASFAVEAPSFAFERRYAIEAARRLGSDHLIEPLGEGEYAACLERAIDAIGEPSLLNESLPGFLRLGERLAAESAGAVLALSATGADGSHGNHVLVAMEILRAIHRLPGASLLLASAHAVGGRPRHVVELGRWIDWLGDTAAAPGIASEPVVALRWFDAGTLRRICERRSALAEELGAGPNERDRVMVAALLSAGLEPAHGISRLLAASGIDTGHPYLDEDAIATLRALPAGERYLRSGGISLWRRVKPVQMALLARSGHATLVGRKKGGGLFTRDLVRWMQRGPLRDLVRSIERPGWMSRGEFERLVERPTGRLWPLLVLDLYRRRLLVPARAAA